MRIKHTTRLGSTLLVSLVSLASPLFCGVAFAESEAVEVDEAREHFRRGIELFNEGNADAAFVELSRAYEISNNYRLLYNLAQVQAERHDYVAAVALFRQYLERGGDEVDEARREAVEKELELLSKRVCYVELTLNVADAEIFLNGVRQESISGREAKLQLNAGVVRLEVRKKGYESHLEEVNVAGGEARQFTITLKAERGVSQAPAPVSPQKAASAPEVSYNYTPFWIGFASTAVLGGAAATFGVFTLDKEKALNEEFDRFPGDPDAQAQQRSDLKTMATVTDALSAATIVAGGISLYLLFDPPKEDEPSEGAELTGFVLRPSGVDLCGSF